MKWILNINKKYKIPYILSNISLIFFDSIGFIIPILVGYLVDSVTIYHNYDKLLIITIAIIIFVIFKTLGSYLSFIKLSMISEKITSTIKQKCYQNINKLDYYFYEHNNKGELMTNFTSDIKNIRRHLNNNIKTIGAMLLTFTFSLVYLLTINVPFTLILLTPGVLVGIASIRFVKKVTPEYEVLRNLMSDSNDFISDNIEANRVVKTFAIEKSEIKNMKKINKKFIDRDIKVCYVEDKYYAIVDFLSYLMSVIFLIIGGYLFIKDHITLGELIIFNNYLYNLRAPFIRISGIMNQIQRYNIAKKRIEKLLNATPKIVLNGEENLSSLLVPIEFKNVRIVYDDKVVLEEDRKSVV